MKMNFCRFATAAATSFAFTFASCLAAAGPLTLSSTPLVVSASVEPNIMILFDTSASMLHVAPSGSYDPDDDTSSWATATCSTNRLTTASNISVTLDVVNLGGTTYPTFRYNGTTYMWGGDSEGASKTINYTQWGTPKTATYSLACFDNDDSIRAFLVENTSLIFSGALDPYYSGHYLNYYFGSTPSASWTTTSHSIHPDQKLRLEVGQDTIESLVNAQPDGLINMGLSRFGSTSSLRIDVPIANLDTTAKGNITTKVASFNGNVYGTPIAESLYQLGRYFIGDSLPGGSNQLTLHPGDASEQDVVYNNVFADKPENGSGTTMSGWTSPITASCQKNFIVAMTDGQNTTDDAINSYLQDYDQDCAGNPATCTGSLDRKNTAGYSYPNSDSTDYMDDVAAALYDIDLRPDLDDPDGNDSKNNVFTYLIGFADVGVQSDQVFADTALNGGTSAPYFPDTEAELIADFNTILNDALGRIGSVASVAFNSSTLSTESAVFQAQFNTARWSGSLFAFPLSDTGVIEALEWDAAAVLDTMSTSDRNIITYNGDAKLADGTTNARDGFEFTWDNLSAAQRADLHSSTIDADNDGNTASDVDDAQLLMSFLIGNDPLKSDGLTKIYRERASRLGDIVNSTPVYVGAPQANWPDYSVNNAFGGSGANESYSAWKAAVANRTPVIYAGANDGMLHGFNADLGTSDDGKELLAFIPGAIASSAASRGLHYLADINYQHQFYVDLTPTLSDVFIDRDGGSSDSWRTVLVGGLGAGGRGLFALDVTDPTEFNDPANNADDIVLWEFTSSDDPDLGYTFSQPTIAMMNNGKWAAIVGNGYNSGEGGVGDGRAKLFILFIEDGADGTWSAGDYIELDTGVGTVANPNGLSTPRVIDLDKDNIADRVYAGDLQGNLWVFDVSDATASNWHSEYGANPLFTATDASSNAQPITTAPIIARNTSTATAGNEPNLMVLFGTGKFLESGDRATTDTMSYYSVWDSGTGNLNRGTHLESRTLAVSGSNRTVTGDAVDWSTQYGWYMDLASKERVISESLLRRDVLFFNTVIPDDTTCSAGGSGWLMSIDYRTGKETTGNAVFDANNDGVIDDNDLGYVGAFFDAGIPAKSGILGTSQYTPGSDGSIDRRDINVGGGSLEGPLSWEEVVRD